MIFIGMLFGELRDKKLVLLPSDAGGPAAQGVCMLGDDPAIDSLVAVCSMLNT